MPTFQNQNLALNYETFGERSNPALIFSNALGTGYQMWQPQIDALQEDYFIICYDTRGHGLSSAPAGPYFLKQLGQDVIDLLDHLQIDSAYFCGVSMGGMTGQWLARHHPERFRHLLVCNTAAKIGTAAPWLERALNVRANGLVSIANTAASRWFTNDFIHSHPETVQQLSESLAAGSSEGYASCCEALATADMRAQLQDIKASVTVLAGTKDPVTTVSDGRYMAYRIPQSTLALIDAAHISNVEEPEIFNQLIREHLSD